MESIRFNSNQSSFQGSYKSGSPIRPGVGLHTGKAGASNASGPKVPQGGKPQQPATPSLPPLGLRVDSAKGLIAGRVAPTTVNGQQVLDLDGALVPVPTGGKPVQAPISGDKVLTLTRLHDGSFQVKTRTLGLEAGKKGKFQGTLVPDDAGKLDIGGRQVDVSGMKPGETKKQTLKIDGKKFKVELRMNADGTFSVEGKRKRGFLGSIVNFVGNIFNTLMPALSVVSMLVPGMQWMAGIGRIGALLRAAGG